MDIKSKLGLTAPTTVDNINFSQYKSTGTKAEVTFNGADASYDTNTFSINGMTFTAKTAQAAGDPAVTVNLTRDVEGIYNNIKNFVDKYNELIDTVNTKVSEKKYKDYKPLSDDERKELKEDQIKQWEEKAKSGMLRSDPLLTRGITSFRNSFSSLIEGLPSGTAKSLSEIGISATIVSGKFVSGSESENGKIYIDDVKLKKAIAERPEDVMALFNANDGVKESSNGDGLARRLSDKADVLMKQITSRAGVSASVEDSYQLGKTTKGLNKRIDAFALKMEALETRYYKQFTAMEKFINQMNAQSAQLSQSFA
ncbi:Flagellar hook-associated protein 2 [compost metagenome]